MQVNKYGVTKSVSLVKIAENLPSMTNLINCFSYISPAGTKRSDNVTSMSMQRHDVASTLMRRSMIVMCLLGERTLRQRHVNVDVMMLHRR